MGEAAAVEMGTKGAAIFEGTPERVVQLSEAAVTAELLYVASVASDVALYETLQRGRASTTYSFSSPSRTRLDTALLQPPRCMLLNEVQL